MKMISILINKLYIVNKYKTFYLKNVVLKFLIKNSNFLEKSLKSNNIIKRIEISKQ